MEKAVGPGDRDRRRAVFGDLWDSLGLDGLPHQKGKKYSVITEQATLDGFSWVAAHQMHTRPK